MKQETGWEPEQKQKQKIGMEVAQKLHGQRRLRTQSCLLRTRENLGLTVAYSCSQVELGRSGEG